MATNPYVNKVEFGGQTLIDLTQDTVTANDVAEGVYFHLPNGQRTVGTSSGGGVDPEDLEIVVSPSSATGTAVVGTAVTTPASFVAVGDVIGEKTTINIPTTAELRWNYSNGELTIQGVALTVAAQTVGTGDATFVGGETSLIIEERQV